MCRVNCTNGSIVKVCYQSEIFIPVLVSVSSSYKVYFVLFMGQKSRCHYPHLLKSSCDALFLDFDFQSRLLTDAGKPGEIGIVFSSQGKKFWCNTPKFKEKLCAKN